ncbi:transglycosylase SLT domain-containing protein, partial [Candidatus Hydrogenedentota bacterium]
EMGLMQITLGARKDYNRRHGSFWRNIFPFDPAVNVEIGTWYLTDSMRIYGTMLDPVPFALARYNAGQGRSDKWLKNARAGTRKKLSISFEEFLKYVTISTTRNYIRDIHGRYKKRRDGA